MNINPISLNFAAEVSDIDVRSITNDEFNRVYEAWLTYGVLRIRRQHINEDELQAFSSRFGPLEEIPMGRLPESERAKIKNRYVTQLSNILKDGKPIGGLGNAEASWHSDMTYLDIPPTASVLYGREVPSDGANTWFANMYAAWDRMPADLAAEVRDAQALHNSS